MLMLRNNCTNLVWVLSIPTSDLQIRKLKPNVSDETLREFVDIFGHNLFSSSSIYTPLTLYIPKQVGK